MITKKTKLILFDTNTQKFIIGTAENRTMGQTHVCTIAHFFDTVGKFFEQVTPNMGENPLWQNVDWQELENEK